MSELRNIRHTIHYVVIAQMKYQNPSPGYLWRCGVVGMLVTFGGDDVRDEPLEAGAGEAFRAKPPRSHLANHKEHPIGDHQDLGSLCKDLCFVHLCDKKYTKPLLLF